MINKRSRHLLSTKLNLDDYINLSEQIMRLQGFLTDVIFLMGIQDDNHISHVDDQFC